MKTSKQFNQNLKKNVVTKEMLKLALYSVNKRAKNYRDKIREFKHCHSLKSQFYKQINESKKEQMYRLKQQLLSFCQPTCIHKEVFGYQRRRIYDYQPQFSKIDYDDVVWNNCYYDYQNDRQVEFVDVETQDQIYHFYLFYDFGDKSFHTPIEEQDIKKFKNLKVIKIDQIITQGDEILDLVSLSFVKKVLKILKENKIKINENI